MKLPIFRKQKTENREQKTFSDSRISAHRSLTSGLGFTLIELLIVIAIISILISIGMAAFSRAQTQARDGERKADIEQIRGALEQYYSDENVYPDTLTWVADLQGSSGLVYLKAVPTNPSGGNYTYTSTGQGYCIGVDLEINPTSGPTCGGLEYGLTAQD